MRPIRTFTAGALAAAALSFTPTLAASAAATPTTPIAPSADATAPTLITEPDQGVQPIDDYIQTATKSIDMTMYALQDTNTETLLGDEASKGITVRVILDSSGNEKSHNTDAYNYLSSHRVSVHWSNSDFTYTHEKSIVVDDSSVAIMSLNLQSQYYSTSRDFAVIDHDSTDVQSVEDTFNADFGNQSITPSDGDHLVWSPTDSQTQLLDLINNASTSLVVENEEMGDADVTDALANAAKRGVDVEVIMTDSYGDYDAAFDQLTQAGAHVVTYDPDASLYIHAKVILADAGTSSGKAFIGSENFSNTSLNKNRELGLITSDSSILSSLQSTLSSDYSGGTTYGG